MDIAGTLPWKQAEGLLAPGGILLPVTASLGAMIGGALRPTRKGRRISGTTSADGPDAMRRLLGLYARGALRPVISASLPFDDIAKAHALAGGGHKRGAVVVTL